MLLLSVERDLRPFLGWLEGELGVEDPKRRAQLVARCEQLVVAKCAYLNSWHLEAHP